MTSIDSNHAEEFGLCHSSPGFSLFQAEESRYLTPLPAIRMSYLLAEPQLSGFSLGKKVTQYGSHLLFPLIFGAAGSGLGGAIGLLLKKGGSFFSGTTEGANTPLPKPGLLTTPLLFGFVFCAAGSAVGEYLAQKASNPQGETHWGAIVSTGLTTFLGAVSGWYAKGLTNYFLFRTAMNFSLTAIGTCIDATVEGKSISKSFYSKDFAISLGLSLCLGETFHFGAKRIFKRNPIETEVPPESGKGSSSLVDQQSIKPPEKRAAADNSNASPPPKEDGGVPAIEDPAPNRVIDDGSISDALARSLSAHSQTKSGKLLIEAELPPLREPVYPTSTQAPNRPVRGDPVPVEIGEGSLFEPVTHPEGLGELPLIPSEFGPISKTPIPGRAEGSHDSPPLLELPEIWGDRNEFLANSDITPVPAGDPFPTPIPGESPRGLSPKRAGEIPLERNIPDKTPEPPKDLSSTFSPDPFADLAAEMERTGMTDPVVSSVSPARMMGGKVGKSRRSLDLPETEGRDPNAPTAVENMDGSSSAGDETKKIRVEDVEALLKKPEENLGNTFGGESTPVRLSPELAQLLADRANYYPEVASIEELNLPDLIRRAFFDEKAYKILIALLGDTTFLISKTNEKIPFLNDSHKNEIFIILRETLLIFHPTRGKWISYLMKHVWPNEFRPTDFLLQKVREVRTNLQNNKAALSRYKDDEALPDLVSALIGTFLD